MAKQKTPLLGMKPSGDDPFTDAAAITPSNTVDLAFPTRSIYVGGTGALTVLMADESNDANTVVFSAIPVATTLRICVRRVLSTGTTATLLVALY